MIYTITLNPAIDYVVQIDEIQRGKINRSSDERIYCGGKGINVSTVLKNFGEKSCVIGFLAGESGQAVERHLKNNGYDTDVVYVENGMTRINIKIREKKDAESAINGIGPDVSKTEVKELLAKFAKLNDGDILIISGSIPKGVSSEIYASIMSMVQEKQIYTIVDAEKELLIPTLRYRPFMVKPNLEELEEIFSIDISKDEVGVYAKKLQAMGAKNVLVSLGAEGAVLVDERQNVYTHDGIRGDVVSTVGAGDSMVAAFAIILKKAIENGEATSINYQEALKECVKFGTATTFSQSLVDKISYSQFF